MFGDKRLEEGIDLYGDCPRAQRSVIKAYAFELCKQLVASLMSRCEFKTYEKGKFVKNHHYYRLNIEPNINKDAATFWREITLDLLNDEQALIIPMNNGFYRATSFYRKPYDIAETQYIDTNVGAPLIKKVMFEREVIYLRNPTEQLRVTEQKASELIDEVFQTIHQQYQLKKYNKFVLEKSNHDSMMVRNQKEEKDKNEEVFGEFLSSKKNAVISVPNGHQMGKIESRMGEGYTDDAPNILTYFEAALRVTASTFYLDVDILYGKPVSVEPFVNLFLKSFCEPIEKELNRKIYSEKELLESTYIKIDPSRILQPDPLTVAKTNDIKLRSGTHSVNDLLVEMGMARIEETWADEHFISLNYAPAKMMVDDENKPKALQKREKKANERNE